MQVDEEDPERAAQYAAWAERMRTKRAATKARIAADAAAGPGTAASAGDRPTSTGPTYWTTDALFAESRRVEEQELVGRPDPMAVRELLAVLDLRDGADPDQLTAAYRRLAKEHHPDRFVHADEATRRFHEERMLEVNRAYRHLRDLNGR